jgi:hypothetical protein
MPWLTIRQSGVRVTVYRAARLSVRDGDVSFELGADRVVAGRSPVVAGSPAEDVLVEVRDVTMSKQHFAITRIRDMGGGADAFALEDLGSTGGTFVNQDRIITHRRRVLHEGDVIHLGAPHGSAKMQFSELPPDDSPRSYIAPQ